MHKLLLPIPQPFSSFSFFIFYYAIGLGFASFHGLHPLAFHGLHPWLLKVNPFRVPWRLPRSPEFVELALIFQSISKSSLSTPWRGTEGEVFLSPWAAPMVTKGEPLQGSVEIASISRIRRNCTNLLIDLQVLSLSTPWRGTEGEVFLSPWAAPMVIKGEPLQGSVEIASISRIRRNCTRLPIDLQVLPLHTVERDRG